MNKTIIININGTVFHIEEQAYELLKEYMTDVKRHFFNSADSLEITTDIENRIAEMFTEILSRENRQAIIDQDVAEVIEQMGSVKDFEYAEENGPTGFAEPAYTHGHSNRRLFRDPDDHLIGGVCAGIAKYFDVQAVWIRLAFALAFTLAGTGFFLYLILLLIIPKAATRADRMAMKGEPLDLQGFKRNFEAELSTVGGRLNDLRHEARPLVYRTRDFISDFFHHLGVFIKGSGKIIIKLLGIAIILSCIGGVIAVIVGLVVTWVFGEPFFSLPDSFFNYHFINQVIAAIALLVIIPLTTLIVVTASAIFNTTSLNRSAGFTLLIIWISALIVFAYHGSRVAAEFRDSAGFTQTINLKPNAKQTYYLQLNESMFFTAEDSSRLHIKTEFKNMVLTDDNDNDGFEQHTVNIDIERSDVPYPVLVEEFTARGPNYENALSNARNTHYVFSQQDSVLKFDSRLRRLKKNQWHNEEVRLTLRIPLNATVMVNEKMKRYINNYVDINACFPEGTSHNDSDNAPFIMTTEGLKCKLDSSVTGLKRKASEEEGTTSEGVDMPDDANTVVAPAPDTIYIDSTITTPARKPVVIRRYHTKKN
jgi:phage shock protein PspC (stress-responsive transcriptional regulator)